MDPRENLPLPESQHSQKYFLGIQEIRPTPSLARDLRSGIPTRARFLFGRFSVSPTVATMSNRSKTVSSTTFLRFSGPPRWWSSEPPRRLAGPDPGKPFKRHAREGFGAIRHRDCVATVGDTGNPPKRNLARVGNPLRRSRAREGFGRISWIPRK